MYLACKAEALGDISGTAVVEMEGENQKGVAT